MQAQTQEKMSQMSQMIQFDLSQVPPADVRNLSSTFLSAVKRFYEDPKNLRDFEKWKAQRANQTS